MLFVHLSSRVLGGNCGYPMQALRHWEQQAPAPTAEAVTAEAPAPAPELEAEPAPAPVPLPEAVPAHSAIPAPAPTPGSAASPQGLQLQPDQRVTPDQQQGADACQAGPSGTHPAAGVAGTSEVYPAPGEALAGTSGMNSSGRSNESFPWNIGACQACDLGGLKVVISLCTQAVNVPISHACACPQVCMTGEATAHLQVLFSAGLQCP